MSSGTLTENSDSSHFKKILRAIFIGIGGNLVIVVFLMTFLHIFETIKFLPWIIAFNTALTGFSMVDKTGGFLAYPKILSAVGGLVNVLITSAVFVLVAVLMFGDFFLGLKDIGFFVAVGIICSELGTLLAIKYFKKLG